MVDDTRLFSKPLAAGVTCVGLLISAMIWVQLSVGVITIDYYTPVIVFAFISNLLVAPVLLVLATRFGSFKFPALAWVHFSMSLMIIYFSQTYSPFTVAWSILILIASTYYGWSGFVSSSVTLAVTGAAYIVLFPQNVDPVLNYAFLSILVISLTVFVSYLFVRVIMSAQKKNRDLMKVQRSEMMQVNRLNTLLNSISDAVLTLNHYGRVTSQNAAAQVFFDTNESLIGRDIDKILLLKNANDDKISIRNLISKIKSTSLRDDLSVGSGDALRHLSIQMSRIRSTFDDSEEYGVVLIIRDITKQKTLEDEKDEFISVTSHELRTPVAIAEGSLSNFMLMQEHNLPPNKLKEAAEEAHKQIIYLAQMINDLSTLSRAERGVGDTVEPINVNELLYNLFAKYSTEAEGKGLRLDLDVQEKLPEVETSRLYLEEILQNFITNALKYTKEGSVVIGAKVEKEGYVNFFVRDTGIGMSKTDLEHIFEKFYRSEDYRTRETSGTGLGLYVVEKLAAKLDTKVKVESRLNVGSTFGFRLSARGGKLAAMAEANGSLTDSQKPEIEDQPEQDAVPKPNAV